MKPGANIVAQGAKFGLVGISNTVIDYTLYLALTNIFRVPIDRVFMVKFISGTVAMFNSFYWNRRWVFASRSQVGKSGVRFLVTTLMSIYFLQPGTVGLFSATGLGQSFCLFWYHLAATLGVVGLLPNLFTENFFIKTVAFGMGVIVSAFWNFTLYRFWAFRDN